MIDTGRFDCRQDVLLKRWPFVGRESELDTFARLLEDPRSQGFAIIGPAGAGKSRLAEECFRLARKAGHPGGTAVATLETSAIPLGAIGHLIPPHVDFSDPIADLAATIQALAAPRGHRWVLVVDDLPLLDEASIVLIRQLMDARAVYLVGTVRSEMVSSEAVESLTRGDSVYRVDLAELDQPGVELVLHHALGGPVGKLTTMELSRVSEGNPLYLRELVLGALESGTLAYNGSIWELTASSPPYTQRLSELVEARLKSSGPSGKTALELLALCGVLPLSDLESVVSNDVLTSLEEAGLVKVTLDGRRASVALAHPLYSEVLRSGIQEERGRELRLEQVERARARGARRREDKLRIASLLLAATGTAEPAILINAATVASRMRDYRQVIALLGPLPESAHTLESLIILGFAYRQVGEFEKAESTLSCADGRASKESDLISVALIRSENLLWVGARPEEALKVNEEARSRVGTESAKSYLLVNEGHIRIAAGEISCGLPLLRSLSPECESSSGANSWARGAIMKGIGLSAIGRANEAIEWSERAHVTHCQLDDYIMLQPADHLIALVPALAEAGRLQEARVTGEKAFAELTVARAPCPRLWAAWQIARVEWLAGHMREAFRWYSEAAALARVQHGNTLAFRPVFSGMAATAALLGNASAAEAALSECTGDLVGEERLGKAWLLAARGNLAEARNVLTVAAKQAEDFGHVATEALLLTDIARLGGSQDVIDRLAELAQICDGVFVPARSSFVKALSDRDPDELLRTSTKLEEIGSNLLAAEAAAAASAMWTEAGESRRAAMASVQADRNLTHCPGVRTPMLAKLQEVVPLTSREREIALLAKTGFSSKDIAQQLTLSVRTIDNHLNRIYKKLGVKNRAELAQALD
ncbi:LuxR C-terminal-related transcriptional regulator [Streptomyces sp. NPDC093595]|uniref:LuxR C-terminal-related transcriptional regulator n=1 Tax=Streptomyces sp. NPDC093595 TaxID=3366045 RepID=UPI0037F3E1DA